MSNVGTVNTQSRKKVLFVAEAVTLAHVARPWILAQSLDKKRYEVRFAADDRFDGLLGDATFGREPLDSIGSDQFMRALAKGTPVYNKATLAAYVEQDRALIDRVRPDLIVGDFRLSLSVSARLAGISYVTISNIYWSPFAQQRYVVPDLPLTKMVGVRLAQTLFDWVRPLAFGLHTIPLNSVRRKFSMPSLGWGLQDIYTDADAVVYADLPNLAGHHPLPETHHFIGPITWSPKIDLPDWWDELDSSRPMIYATLGSSGNKRLLPSIVQSLGHMDVVSMVASAGANVGEPRPGKVFCAEYLPGAQAAARSSIVICNGGSPTTYQALAAGVPVIGIATNLDQFLNMSILEEAGVGVLLRSDRFSAHSLNEAVEKILSDTRYRQRAERIRGRIVQHSPAVEFPALLDRM